MIAEGTMSDQHKEDKNREREQDYLRIISHQLKSPINSIQSLLGTITEGYTGEVNPQTKQVIEKAINRVSEARELISDIMDYQRYLQTDTLTDRSEYDIVELCRRLARSYSSQAAEKDVALHTDLPTKQIVMIEGDEGGMEQALRNLIENAIRYTPTGGTVTILAKSVEQGKRCRIKIIDTGYGIPKNEIENIFKPFYRAIKHKLNISGTGLGLPIVKKVVENHSGTISVSSVENEGSTFDIVLPVSHLRQTDTSAVERKKVLIIGGVTAGPKAAARLRRLDEDLDITIIERNRFLSYSGCGLPAYINGQVNSPKELMSTVDATVRDVNFFQSIMNITILNETLALNIDRHNKTVRVRELADHSEYDLAYDYLVLSTGSKPFTPDVPGINEDGIYTLHSLEDAERIKKEFAKPHAQDVFILGAGLIGISSAESFTQIGKRVTILEKQPNILGNLMDRDIAEKLQNELQRTGIKVITRVELQEVRRIDGSLSIITNRGKYNADLLILSAGVIPNVDLATEAGLDLGPSGGIQVNKQLQTSDECIYAIGDCAESINIITGKHEYWPLGSISTKMGRVAADTIAGLQSEFIGSLGTVLFKIADINVAGTGLTVRNALKDNIEIETAVCTGFDKAHYYGKAENIVLKVIAEKETQRILGAQMYGKGEITGRIGVFANAISQGLTLNDFFKTDLGYSPAFNNPIDIIQTGALVLKNKMDMLVRMITPHDFEKQRDEIDGIVSVCPLSVYSQSIIPDSINIPLENIRDTRFPFEKDARVVLYSRTSSGAYVAYRFLTSLGFSKLLVLEGGYEFWKR